ncbi:hypothetical protein [Brevundimonas sp.]|uniref:hypothetical protein n=1 Tax=Brevundimonas sp. TaxID=1871086 RepID=UPI002ABA3E2A|nr:hypothetical protein [Brevundimonas sp.]MDZ4362727.1 hypothetical protein [Brevundimonas sp.]
MKSILAALTIANVCLLACSAAAQNAQYGVAVVEDGSVLAVDYNSVRRMDNGIVRAEVMAHEGPYASLIDVYPEADFDGPFVAVANVEVDCQAITARTTSVTYFDVGAQNLGSQTRDDRQSGDDARALVTAVCGSSDLAQPLFAVRDDLLRVMWQYAEESGTHPPSMYAAAKAYEGDRSSCLERSFQLMSGRGYDVTRASADATRIFAYHPTLPVSVYVNCGVPQYLEVVGTKPFYSPGSLRVIVSELRDAL